MGEVPPVATPWFRRLCVSQYHNLHYSTELRGGQIYPTLGNYNHKIISANIIMITII